MTLSDIERQDAKGPFFRQISIQTLIPFHALTYKNQIRDDNMLRRVMYLMGQTRSHSIAVEPQRPKKIRTPAPIQYNTHQANFA